MIVLELNEQNGNGTCKTPNIRGEITRKI